VLYTYSYFITFTLGFAIYFVLMMGHRQRSQS